MEGGAHSQPDLTPGATPRGMRMLEDVGMSASVTASISVDQPDASGEGASNLDVQLRMPIFSEFQLDNPDNLAQREQLLGQVFEMMEFVLKHYKMRTRQIPTPPGLRPLTQERDIVVFVSDPNPTTPTRLKMNMVFQFKPEVVKLWFHLADNDMAPKLYSFATTQNDKIKFEMEELHGKTMDDVICSIWSQPEQARSIAPSFALIMLDRMLEIFQKMQEVKISHCDLHGNNVILEKTMKLKFIDFDTAKSQLLHITQDPTNPIQLDIICIIRLFCELFSGHMLCEGRLRDVKRLLETDSLDMLKEEIKNISEEDRDWMFKTIMMLFETVRDPNRRGFGDVREVREFLREQLNYVHMWYITRMIAVIVFPERFQRGPLPEESDGLEYEGELDIEPLKVRDPHNIWNDPILTRYAKMVKREDLRAFGLLD